MLSQDALSYSAVLFPSEHLLHASFPFLFPSPDMAGTTLELTIPVTVSQVHLTFSNCPYTFAKANKSSFLGYPSSTIFNLENSQLILQDTAQMVTTYVSQPHWEAAPSFPGLPSHSANCNALQVCLASPAPREPFRAGTKSFHLSLPPWLPLSLLGNDSYPYQAGMGAPKLHHPTDAPSWVT